MRDNNTHHSKTLYGCPFEKIHFLSKIDTNFGFGRDFMVKVDYIMANEGIWPKRMSNFMHGIKSATLEIANL